MNAGEAKGAYGDNRLVNPVPETVPEELRFVNAAVFGVVPPIGPGEVRFGVAAATNASVAIFVELSPVVCVGAVGLPVKAGEAKGAYGATNAENPDPDTVPVAVKFAAVAVPVNVGDASGAYGANSVLNPAPDTVPVALKVVNAPVFGATEPMVPGDPQFTTVLFASTNASVAIFVELSPTVCVTAVVCVGNATVPVKIGDA